MAVIDYTTTDVNYINENTRFIKADLDSINQFEFENNVTIYSYETQTPLYGVKYRYYDIKTDKWVFGFGYVKVITKMNLDEVIIDNGPDKVILTTNSDDDVVLFIDASTDITYDWGDGTIDVIPYSEYDPKSKPNYIEHTYTDLSPLHIITITADDIVYISCEDSYIVSIDLSKTPLLEVLYAYYNYDMVSLDVTQNPYLTDLDFKNNPITELNISQNPLLTYLYCASSLITTLDISNNPLIDELYAYNCNIVNQTTVDNIISTLDMNGIENGSLYLYDGTTANPSPNGIIHIENLENKGWDVEYNEPVQVSTFVTSKETVTFGFEADSDILYEWGDGSSDIISSGIDASHTYTTIGEHIINTSAINVTEIYCQSNQLTSLDISNNTALIYLECFSNELTSLNVDNNLDLTNLFCYDNELTNIDNILDTLDQFGSSYGNIQLQGGTNVIPSAAGFVSKTSLEGKGWNVKVNDLLQVSTLVTESSYMWIALSASSDAIIDWGDGSSGSTSSYLEHNYNDGKTIHIVKVSANTITNLSSNETELTSIDVSDLTDLTELNCSGNTLETLDLSNNTELTSLSCYDNQIVDIDMSNNTKLTFLNANNNSLTDLDISNNRLLTYIDCSDCVISKPNDIDDILYKLNSFGLNNGTLRLNDGTNAIPSSVGLGYKTSLEGKGWTVTVNELVPEESTFVSTKDTVRFTLYADSDITYDWGDGATGTTASGVEAIHTYIDSATGHTITTSAVNVTKIYCRSNSVTSLDVSANILLDTLYCDSNKLDSLNISSNAALTYLNCQTNKLEILGVDNNKALKYLYCDNNELTELNVDNNKALIVLFCSDNIDLTSLIVDNNTKLTTLSCSNIALISLNIDNNTKLTYLDCRTNKLTNTDDILYNLDQVDSSYGIGNIRLQGGTNAIPSSLGLGYKTSLESKGWFVEINEPVPDVSTFVTTHESVDFTIKADSDITYD